MSKRPRAVVLLSGGMDSCVCATLAVRDYEVALLHCAYGQRTEARERQAFQAMADHWGVEQRLVVENGFFRQIGGSALTDEKLAVPESGMDIHGEPSRRGRGEPTSGRRRGQSPRQRQAVPVTYVPFRNAHFLAAGVSWAEVWGADRVVIGAVAPDSSGYPDCRPEYYEAFNALLRVGTKAGEIQVETPLLHMTKAAIVRLGLELGAPFHLSWSCYQNSTLACGRCDSCRLRRGAFGEAGAGDPIAYATWEDT